MGESILTERERERKTKTKTYGSQEVPEVLTVGFRTAAAANPTRRRQELGRYVSGYAAVWTGATRGTRQICGTHEGAVSDGKPGASPNPEARSKGVEYGLHLAKGVFPAK